MYTAQSIAKDLLNGRLTVVVEYTNGTDTFTESLYATTGNDPNWLQNAVNRKLDDLNSLETFAAELKLGKVKKAIKSLEAPQEVDQWRSDYQKFRAYQETNQLGITSPSDPDFAALKAKVKAGFKKDFLP
jgi:hypothetical protein